MLSNIPPCIQQRQGRDAETRTQTENDLRKQLLEREFRVSSTESCDMMGKGGFF